MRTLSVVMEQIKKLEAEADAIRKVERVAVIQRVMEAINTYHLLPHELFPVKRKIEVDLDWVEKDQVKKKAVGGGSKGRKLTATKKTRFVPKKKDPPRYARYATYSDGTNTWHATGRVPAWFKDILNQGKDAANYLISVPHKAPHSKGGK